MTTQPEEDHQVPSYLFLGKCGKKSDHSFNHSVDTATILAADLTACLYNKLKKSSKYKEFPYSYMNMESNTESIKKKNKIVYSVYNFHPIYAAIQSTAWHFPGS